MLKMLVIVNREYLCDCFIFEKGYFMLLCRSYWESTSDACVAAYVEESHGVIKFTRKILQCVRFFIILFF